MYSEAGKMAVSSYGYKLRHKSNDILTRIRRKSKNMDNRSQSSSSRIPSKDFLWLSSKRYSFLGILSNKKTEFRNQNTEKKETGNHRPKIEDRN